MKLIFWYYRLHYYRTSDGPVVKLALAMKGTGVQSTAGTKNPCVVEAAEASHPNYSAHISWADAAQLESPCAQTKGLHGQTETWPSRINGKSICLAHTKSLPMCQLFVMYRL